MWCASTSASRSPTMPDMPLIEWKLRNSSSSAGRRHRLRGIPGVEVEQQAPDVRQVLVALGEVVVHELGGEGVVAHGRGSIRPACLLGQPLRRERFGEIDRRARGQGRAAARLVAARRQHDHRQRLEHRVTANECEHLETVHVGHVEIEDHQRDGAERELLARLRVRCRPRRSRRCRPRAATPSPCGAWSGSRRRRGSGS